MSIERPVEPTDGRQPDALYPAAFRLARYHAILSPRILMGELRIDREHAERLLAEMETQGAVGPTLIRGTGARESRVNVVEDRPSGPAVTLLGTDPRAGRRTVALAATMATLGLLAVAALTLLDLGGALVRWFNVELGSRVLAAVLRATVPLLGLGLGWLAEYPFRSAEDFASHGALRVRQAIWSGALVVAIFWALLRLLS